MTHLFEEKTHIGYLDIEGKQLHVLVEKINSLTGDIHIFFLFTFLKPHQRKLSKHKSPAAINYLGKYESRLLCH